MEYGSFSDWRLSIRAHQQAATAKGIEITVLVDHAAGFPRKYMPSSMRKGFDPPRPDRHDPRLRVYNLDRVMADRLDAVAIGIPEERCII